MRTGKAPIRVLVVEDAAEIRELLSEALRDEGYEVSLAEDGIQAVNSLDSIYAGPAVVLLDISLPSMDGIEVLRRKASRAKTRSIPVIVVSASAKSIPADLRQQIRVVLDKPFDLDELLTHVACAAGAPGPTRTARDSRTASQSDLAACPSLQ